MAVSTYLTVGAGLFGGVFARQVAEAGRSVLLIDRREHIAGNCYSHNIDGVEVHRYGPHIFHTDNESVWKCVNRFARFNDYRHHGVVRSGGQLFSFPINLLTLHQLWGVVTPAEAEARLASERVPIERPRTWKNGRSARLAPSFTSASFAATRPSNGIAIRATCRPPSSFARIPIRMTWDDHYFDDAFQGIPVDGYTRLFENLLDHPRIRLETNVDFFIHRKELKASAARRSCPFP